MKNKEIFIVIGIIIISFILVFAFSVKSKSNNSVNDSNDVNSILENAEKESNSVKSSELKELNNINVSDYLEFYAGEESKLVLVARPTCHYCQIAEPILQNLAYKYDLEINYLNTDDFSEEDDKRFTESDEFLKNGIGTPLLLNVGKNKIIDKVDGLTDSAHYIKFFKDNSYIK